MTVIAVVGTKGAPGTTTVALLLAALWPAASTPSLLVEADPDGGSLAARTGTPVSPGLASLAAATRHSGERVRASDHGHPLLLGPILIPAPPSAEQTTAMLGRAGHLSQSLRVHGGTAVVDCGRASPASAAWTLVVSADVVVLVTRPRLDHVQHASWQLGALRGERSPVVIALVGSRPYPASEVAAALDTPVAAVIADDAPTAEHLPRLALDRTTLRTPLVRSAQTLVVAVHRLAGADTEPSTHPSVEGAGR